MYPGVFDYDRPETLQEAMELLATKAGAKILAGGQSLLPSMKQRFTTPSTLIDITHVHDLIQVQDEGDTVLVGPKLTQAIAMGHEVLRQDVPLLAHACSWVADRQVRRMGTVCGAVANAEQTSDACCATLCLGGTILARSVDGEREIAADDFFLDNCQSALKPHEVLVAIRFPKSRPGEGWGYDKLGVRGGHSGWAITGVAAWVSVDAGKIRSARLAVSGASHLIIQGSRAASMVIGTSGSESTLKEAARVASEEIEVIDDINGSIAYKKQLVQVYARRALTQAVANARL